MGMSYLFSFWGWMGRNFRILLIWALIHSQIFCLLLLFWEFCYIRKWIVTFIFQIAQTYWTYYLVELTNFSLLGIGLSFQEGNFYTMLRVLHNKEHILSACHVHNLILVDTHQKIFAFTNNWQMKVRKELWCYVLHMVVFVTYRVTQDIFNQSVWMLPKVFECSCVCLHIPTLVKLSKDEWK